VTSRADPDLVAACLAGDAAAWAALLARYLDLVHGLARSSGLDEALSQDVVQEVSLALWKALPRLRRSERLLPWILTTTRREAWRQGRRRRGAARRERDQARPEASPPAPRLEDLEDQQAVREALAELDERCRRLLRALYFEASDVGGYDGVAERLGIPRGSIGPTRARCLERLAVGLEARGLGPQAGGLGGQTAPGRVSGSGTSASSRRKRT
jgi:RNA polymerase sigma factor (sigma-70 family)